jgi:protein phosphatase
MKYDVIGDIHGCYFEFSNLLEKLGYKINSGLPTHPDNRKLVFLGDITDRGPDSIKMIEYVSRFVLEGDASYTPGNHCDKLYRYLIGRNVQIQHGLETTVEEYNNLTEENQRVISSQFCKLIETAPLYLKLDEGKLIVAHAGIKENLIGRKDKTVKRFVLYGDITGEKDEVGMPIRRDWAQKYTGNTLIIYGHTPVKDPRKVNQTWNIDTGCVFGGKLTAFRYPELTTVSVPSTMPLVSEKFRSFD